MQDQNNISVDKVSTHKPFLLDILHLSGITKQLDGNLILKDIGFRQQRFKKLAIAGETGAGKTTLLKIIAGIELADSGQVLFEKQKVLGPNEKLIPGHDGIEYISQHFELRNNYRVEEELAYTNQLSEKDAATIFEICRIDHLLKRWTDELSGGEKQRIVTARALIASPRLLLLDEPFSNLDMGYKQIMKSVIDDITGKLKITCILVSHDPLDILSWADEILVIKDGELIQQGKSREVYLQPVNEYAAGLFGRYNLITPANAKLFSAFPSVNLNEKNILMRPEHFKIATEKEEPVLKGVIKKISYFGSHTEIEVLVEKTIIIVRTNTCDLAEGDLVYLSPEIGEMWYL